MTRKDYVRIARELRAVCEVPAEYQGAVATAGAYMEGYSRAVCAVARALAADNPRFSWDRFLDAAYGTTPRAAR